MARRERPSKMFYPENIPSSLRNIDQWVCWEDEEDASGRITKTPINPNAPGWARRKDSDEARKAGRRASSTNPVTWTVFSVAKKIAEREGHGIGFAVQGTGLVGIDLDHVIGDDGQLEPWAQEVVEGVNSYTEISPSGDGLRIFAVATIPRALKPSDLGLEMYVSGRYLTVTGERWPGAPGEIAERPDEVMAVFDRYAKDDGDAHDAAEPPVRGTVSLSDAKTLEAIAASRQAEKFRQLYDGGPVSYRSDSEADAALAFMLAFWCGNDEAQVEGLMLSSGRVREKWSTKRGALTWLQYTIRNAVKKNTQVYEPRKSKPLTWAEKLTLKLARRNAAGETT